MLACSNPHNLVTLFWKVNTSFQLDFVSHLYFFCLFAAIPLDPVDPAPAKEPTPSTQEAQGQPRSTDLTVSSHSKKSKKHKRFAATGSEVFLVGLSDLLTRLSAYNLSSCLQPTSQPSSQHKSKSHHGHKRKKHESPSRSGETKKKRHHKVLTPEAPAADADTIVVDTSILNKAPDPAVGTSQSTSTSAAVALGKENQDAVSPASTQADAFAEPSQPVADYTPSSSVSSLARPLQSIDTAGEFIGFPIQISDSDSDSVTSPAMYTDSSSTSSDSSLSLASLPLQDPRGPVGVETNKKPPSPTTPLSTASPSSQTTPLSAASPSSFQGLAIKPSSL
ncbi:adhesin AWP1-like [Lathyrus oleraceus]|uniref:adhesin AWP1-like n=1 Tax=Pisum sativum TaxID=3888 RepID=UPI0021D2531A|nr:adhesin AWP1-like [Pisum sativum]